MILVKKTINNYPTIAIFGGCGVTDRSFHKKYFAMLTDSMELKQLIIENQLDWAIAKPSRLTQDAPIINKVTASVDLKMGQMSKISREDLTSFLLDQIPSETYPRQAVFVRG